MTRGSPTTGPVQSGLERDRDLARSGGPIPGGDIQRGSVRELTLVPGSAAIPAEGSCVIDLRDDAAAEAGPAGRPAQGPLASLRVLVADPMPSATRKPGVATSAVAALLSRMGLDTRWSATEGPDEAMADVEAAVPHLVMLVLHADGDHHDPEAWERPAALTRAYQKAGVPVMAVSIGGSAAALAGCVEQGARAVFDLEQLPAELAEMARMAAPRSSRRGETWGRNGRARSDELSPDFEALIRLTPTERRVLYHLTEGLSAGEIAAEMIVSLSTVRAHVRAILRKLGVSSQLAAVAIANGAQLLGHRHLARPPAAWAGK